MKHIFVDANIIIDFLATREPFSTEAATLFELAENSAVKLFVASVSFNVVYYVLRQKFGHKVTIGYLNDLTSLVTILSITEGVIKNALASDNSDFEDSIQYYAAINDLRIQAIVSRDKKWFRKSTLPIFNVVEVLELIA